MADSTQQHAAIVARIAGRERPPLDGITEPWLQLAKAGLAALDRGENPAAAIEDAISGLNGDIAQIRLTFYEATDKALVEEAPMAVEEGETQASQADYSDKANGEYWAERNANKVRYVPVWGRPPPALIHDGSRWKNDDTLKVRLFTHATVDALLADARSEPDPDLREEKLNWARKSRNRYRMNSMESEAIPLLAIHPDVLDTDPMLLNPQNGTIDLRTAELRPHNADDLITKLIPFDFDPTATAPRWIAFLHEIMAGNEGLISFIQRAVGYSLTALVIEQVLFFLYGLGQNGKSTFLGVLFALLAEYAKTAAVDSFLSRAPGRIPNDIAALKGARVVITSEPEAGQSLSESLIKQLTGGDPISARFMHGEWFTFEPTFKIWMAGNHRPRIRGTDDGIWRRIHLIPFNVSFPPDKRDPDLKDYLLTNELPGILAWAVEGCLAWQREGLAPPPEVQAAKQEYREDQDVLGAFFDDCCVVHEGAEATAGTLYSTYKQWGSQNSEEVLSQRAFGSRLKDRGFQPGRRSNERFWRGIGLAADPQQQPLTGGA